MNPSGMQKTQLSPDALAALVEHLCRLHLRPADEIPDGLWSWLVYIDGNRHARGPGSTRKDPSPWYALLAVGPHRIVLRKGSGAAAVESNTLEFVVEHQSVLIVDVGYSPNGVVLSVSAATDVAAQEAPPN